MTWPDLSASLPCSASLNTRRKGRRREASRRSGDGQSLPIEFDVGPSIGRPAGNMPPLSNSVAASTAFAGNSETKQVRFQWRS
jgi:hypothetical protein